MEDKDDVAALLRGTGAALLTDEPMSRHTSFKVGGAARYFATVTDIAQLEAVLGVAASQGLSYVLLGNGSNLLVSDRGYPGLVIRLGGSFADIQTDGTRLEAGAAASLSRVSAAATEASLTGLEFAGGIPGTVGGAIVMNAGAYGGEMAQVVTSAEILFPETAAVEIVSAEELHFGYRHSLLKEKEGIVLSVAFGLQNGIKNDIVETVSRLRYQRAEKQPLEYPSAGSTFRRPAGAYAGKLIQDAGLAGYTVGGAQVSKKHCGFVINRGDATAAEIYRLIREIQGKVKASSGIDLETEVILLGDFEEDE